MGNLRVAVADRAEFPLPAVGTAFPASNDLVHDLEWIQLECWVARDVGFALIEVVSVLAEVVDGQLQLIVAVRQELLSDAVDY
jgi:hypothetical protein